MEVAKSPTKPTVMGFIELFKQKNRKMFDLLQQCGNFKNVNIVLYKALRDWYYQCLEFFNDKDS